MHRLSDYFSIFVDIFNSYKQAVMRKFFIYDFPISKKDTRKP